jgi:hypothetical protein
VREGDVADVCRWPYFAVVRELCRLLGIQEGTKTLFRHGSEGFGSKEFIDTLSFLSFAYMHITCRRGACHRLPLRYGVAVHMVDSATGQLTVPGEPA